MSKETWDKLKDAAKKTAEYVGLIDTEEVAPKKPSCPIEGCTEETTHRHLPEDVDHETPRQDVFEHAGSQHLDDNVIDLLDYKRRKGLTYE